MSPAAGQCSARGVDHRSDRCRLHQRGRSAAEEDRGQPCGQAAAAPHARDRRAKRRASFLVDRRADMAVEVAIGTFADAERPVDVERQRLCGPAKPRPYLFPRPTRNHLLRHRCGCCRYSRLLLATPSARRQPTHAEPELAGPRRPRRAAATQDGAQRRTIWRVRRFGVPAMGWSDQLAADALGHARYMASTGIYGHDQTPGRRKTSGENLWRGQRGLFSYDVMVGGMIEEARYFRPGVFPDNSQHRRMARRRPLHADRLAGDDRGRLRARLQRRRPIISSAAIRRGQQGRRVWPRTAPAVPASQQLAKRGD